MRRRLRRRLFWPGVLFGLLLLYVVVSAMRLCLWAHTSSSEGMSRTA